MEATIVTKSKDSEKKSIASVFSGRIFWTILALVILVLVDVIKDPSFLSITYSNGGLRGPIMTVLTTAAPYMMIGVGMTIVVSTAGIDLSVGSVMAAAGAFALTVISGKGGSSAGMALVAIAMAIVVSIIIGLVNGLLVSQVGLQPFITTLIMMLAVRGIAKTITGGQNLSVQNGLYKWIGQGYVLGIPAAFVLGTVIVVLVAVLMRKTALGMMIESVGVNLEASRMAGLKPKTIIFSVYVISAILACFGGIFLTGYTSTVNPSQTGQSFEMYAVLAVVIGGTSLLGGKFSISGAYIGSIIISLINTTIVWLGISNEATPAFIAGVVIIICVLQSNLVHSVIGKRKGRKGLSQPPAAGVAIDNGAGSESIPVLETKEGIAR